MLGDTKQMDGCTKTMCLRAIPASDFRSIQERASENVSNSTVLISLSFLFIHPFYQRLQCHKTNFISTPPTLLLNAPPHVPPHHVLHVQDDPTDVSIPKIQPHLPLPTESSPCPQRNIGT